MDPDTHAAREDLIADADPRDKGCPVCFALPDEACTTPDGKPRKDHVARQWLTESDDE